MTIAARVIRDAQGATVVACVHMTTQRRGATQLDRAHRPTLLHGQPVSVALPIPRAMVPEDIGHLDVATHQRRPIYEADASRAGH